MIGKLIRMNRRQRRAHARKIRQAVVALSRYIVDADPHRLVRLGAGDVLSLSDYAFAVEALGVEPGEKVEAFGARHLLGDKLQSWQAQMLAVTARGHGVANPLIHIVLSLGADERWTMEQREEAIDIVTATLGLSACQLIWAEHGNTANPHLHLAILRIDKQTGRAAGSDWLIDDLHQALAIVEERQGRARAPGALYVARAGAVYDVETDALVRDAAGHYQPEWYKAKGVKHVRLPAAVREITADLIEAAHAAESWEDLHAAFRRVGADFDEKGSGALITAGGKTTKASVVHPTLSLPRLERKFGSFEPDRTRQDDGYERYRAAFNAQLAGLRAQRAAECGRLDDWSARLIASLGLKTAPVIAAAIDAERMAARAALDAAFKEAITGCTRARLTAERWREAGSPALPPEVPMPALILPSLSGSGEAAAKCLADLIPSHQGWQTNYHDRDSTLLFTDHRIAIIVHRNEHDAVAAALQLAADRWGTVRVTGRDDFVARSLELATRMGISLVGHDGQPLSLPAPRVEAPRLTMAASPMIVPEAEPERDVQRRQEIEAIARVAAGHLPLRRRPGGKLELIIDGDERFDVIDPVHKQIALLDHDPEVQRLLEQSRAATLREIEAQLRPSRSRILEPEGAAWQAIDRGDAPLRRAAALAEGDPAFHDMMERVRALWEAERFEHAGRDRRRRSAIDKAIVEVRALGTEKAADVSDLGEALRSGQLVLERDRDVLIVRAVPVPLAALVEQIATTASGRAALMILADATNGYEPARRDFSVHRRIELAAAAAPAATADREFPGIPVRSGLEL